MGDKVASHLKRAKVHYRAHMLSAFPTRFFHFWYCDQLCENITVDILHGWCLNTCLTFYPVWSISSVSIGQLIVMDGTAGITMIIAVHTIVGQHRRCSGHVDSTRLEPQFLVWAQKKARHKRFQKHKWKAIWVWQTANVTTSSKEEAVGESATWKTRHDSGVCHLLTSCPRVSLLFAWYIHGQANGVSLRSLSWWGTRESADGSSAIANSQEEEKKNGIIDLRWIFSVSCQR